MGKLALRSFLLLLLATAAGAQLPACGDCDGNGQLQILDALLAAQHGVGVLAIPTPEFEACDIYPAGGNGQIGIIDALQLGQLLVGLPRVLDCTIPPGLLLETFEDTIQRDELLTDADWGTHVAGSLTAGRIAQELAVFSVTDATSSVPFRDSGARTQLLFTAAELGYNGGRLEALHLFLGADEVAGRTYEALEVKACQTTVASLDSNFQSNYDGAQPIVIKPAATEVYPAAGNGSTFDLRINPASFVYNGTDNLLIEISHAGASARTELAVASALTYCARLHSADPLAGSGLVGTIGYEARLTFSGAFAANSEAVSKWLDTGSAAPLFTGVSADLDVPAGTAIQMWFQGALDDGAGQPLSVLQSQWVLSDPRPLAGYRFVRFRVQLTAQPLVTPAVLRLRLPYFP